MDFAKQFNMFLNPITHGHVAYAVDDIEAAKRKLDERGVCYADVRNYFMSDLYQIYTTDPEGNVVETTKSCPDSTNAPALAWPHSAMP